MATHSSTLAQKIPWMEELGAGYCPWGHKELDTTERFHFTLQLSQFLLSVLTPSRNRFLEGRSLSVTQGKFPNLSHRFKEVVIFHGIVVMIKLKRTFWTLVLHSFLFLHCICGPLHGAHAGFQGRDLGLRPCCAIPWETQETYLTSRRLIFLACKLGIIKVLASQDFCCNQMSSG